MEAKDIISSGLLELYVLGVASPEEAVQVEQWMLTYPEVKAEVVQIENAMMEYAIANAVEPSVELKSRIADRLGIKPNENLQAVNTGTLRALPGKASEQKIHTISTFFKWAAAACFILLLGSLALNYSYFNKYRSSNNDLKIAQAELQRQTEIAAAMSRDINVVTDKNARPVVLNGTPHAPDALAKIFWMKNSGEVYVDPSNLPQPAAGKQYQLWAIVDGKPVDAGMIPLNMGNIKIQKMKSFGSAEAFAITLEKAGGSPTPTMEEMYVMAKI